MQPHSPWNLQMFGGLRLQRGKQVVTRFRTRPTDGIFAYLALHLGKRVRREVLVELGWPNAEIAQGQQSLRMALSSIRQTLGQGVLEADRNSVRLVPECFCSDVEEFYRTRHIALYRGRLLEGFHDQWVSVFAAELEDLYVKSLLEHCDTLAVAEAVTLCAEAARRDPGRLDLRAKLRELGEDAMETPSVSRLFHGTSFVGREHERKELEALLSERRLITLTGLGGSGKTRLAAELCRRGSPEAWFVALADLDEAADIPDAIRQALRLPPSPTRSALEQVVAALGNTKGLLVLDNYEHLVPRSGVIEDLLTRCPELRILVTSRIPLGLQCETEYSLGSLALNSGGGTVLSDSALLFEDRVRSILPRFSVDNENVEAVEELCRQLDGFPLALEIAAAKARVFSPSEMLIQLRQRLDFLTETGKPKRDRHRSLRATLDWSFDRLSDADQTLLTTLSVFRGGFTLDAVEKICDAPKAGTQLETLLAHSWVERLPSSVPTRFRLLESIREYGAELLPPKQRDRIAEAHARYYLQVAVKCVERTFTSEEPELHRTAETEIHNLDSAWAWLRNRDPEATLWFVTGLNWYWILRGQAHTGEVRAKEALRLADSTPRYVYANAHLACGNFILFQGRYADSEPWFRRGYELAGEIGHSLLMGLTQCQIAHGRAELGDHDAARKALDIAIPNMHESGVDSWIAGGYITASLVANRAGDAELAHEMGSTAVQYSRCGGYRWGLASALNELAMACYLRGDYSGSLELQEESIALKREAVAPLSLSLSLIDKTASLVALGRISDAQLALQEALRTLVTLGATGVYPHLFGVAGQLFMALDRREEAAGALGTMLYLAGSRPQTHLENKLSLSLLTALGEKSKVLFNRATLKSVDITVEAILTL